MSRRDGSIYVGRLSKSTRTRDLEEIFEPYGRLQRCDIKYGSEMAYAFIDFEDRRDAEDCVKYEHGREINGQSIIVEWAKGGKDRRMMRRPDSSSQSYDECFRCRRTGHWARDCPDLRWGGRRGGGGGGGGGGGRRWRSPSPRQRSRSRDRKRKSRSGSRDRRKRSRSRDRKRSSSRSGDRKRSRSRSGSHKSRSDSDDRKKGSRSKSGSREKKKDSTSRSRSKSPQHSNSKSHSKSPRQPPENHTEQPANSDNAQVTKNVDEGEDYGEEEDDRKSSVSKD